MKTNFNSRILVLFLIIAGTIWLSLSTTRPPAVVPASAPETEFSAERAMKHVVAISREPHVTGSPEIYQVRDYLLGELRSLGLNPETQVVVAQNHFRENKVALAENIFAKIPGTNSTQAILIIGHYDTGPTSPGAADDGIAVAAMLETARALKAGHPLENDIIFLFSDAEESAFSGANAARKHPWVADVGLVLNLEMRGGAGPVYLVETGPDNGKIIPEFAKAVPYPVGTSLSREVYKVMPNNTDFTIYRDSGYAGFNFSSLEKMTQYHTPLGTPENLDQRSLQHHGYYILSITRHFGNLNLENIKASDAVYFDIFGRVLIHYPGFLSIPLTILVTILFIGLVVFGRRRGHLTTKGIGQGFLAFLIVLVGGPGAVTALWYLIRATVNPPVIEGEIYNSPLYFLGYGFLVVAISAYLYGLFRRKVSTANLAIGALLWWVILLIGVTLVFPTANFTFLWPLLFALIGVGDLFFTDNQRPLNWAGVVILSIAAIPGLLLLPPGSLALGMGLIALVSVTGVSMVIISLLIGLLVPHLEAMTWSDTGLGRWWLSAGSAVLGAIVLIIAMVTIRTDARHPRAYHLIYGLDADSGQTIWASIDASKFSREWTENFFSQQATSGPLPQFFGSYRPVFIVDQAPAVPLSPPEIEVLEDTQEGDVRKLRLLVRSTQGATHVKFYIEPPAEVISVAINGEPVKVAENPPDREEPWELRYWGPLTDGMELSLEVRSSQGIEMRVVEVRVGLPENLVQSIAPRPENMTTFTCYCLDDADMTFISRSVTLDN